MVEIWPFNILRLTGKTTDKFWYSKNTSKSNDINNLISIRINKKIH